MNADEVQAQLAERNRALLELDMEWAARTWTGTKDPNVWLIAMHKSRYEITSLPDAARHASRAWLEERGYSRFNRIPWPPQGKLPNESGSVE